MNNVVNGTITNEQLIDPNTFIVVKNKRTGSKVSLPSMKYFNAKFHERIALDRVEEVEVSLDEEAKFQELKAQKAWLKPDLKDLYSKLKAKYGK